MSDQNYNNYYGQQMPPQQVPQQQMPPQQMPPQQVPPQQVPPQQMPPQQMPPQQMPPQQMPPQEQVPQQQYYQPQQGYYQIPGAPSVQAPYIPQATYYQQPYYQQQMPQGQAPQGQIPYVSAQPYYGAPAPIPGVPEQPSPEPEVILQKSMFEEYGFSDEEASSSNHNFGGFMEDNNEPEEEPLPENIFTSTTPNYTEQDMEEMSNSSTVEKSAFTSTTKTLNLEDVENAAKTETDIDRDVFSNSVPVSERVPEEELTAQQPAASSGFTSEPAAEEKPAVDFMASMKSMFSSMGATAAAATAAATAAAAVQTATPVVEAVAPVVPVVPEAPVVSEVPVAPTAPAAPAVTPTHEAPVVSVKPDVVINAEQESTIQDISSTTSLEEKPEEEKGPEYWVYMNTLLDNFDDGKVHSHMEEERKAPTVVPQEKEERRPFSEGAVNPEPATDIPAPQETTPHAPQEVSNRGIFIKDVTNAELKPASAHVEAVSESPEVKEAPTASVDDDKSWLVPEDINDKSLKAEAKAKKAEEKAAIKAKRAEEKAAKKAAKEALKAEKKKDVSEAVPAKESIPMTDDDISKDRKGFKKFLAKVFPVKGDPVGEIIRKLVVIISFIVLVGCVSWLLSIFIQGQSNAKVYDELSDKMKQSETTKDDWSSIYEKYPNVQFPSGMQTKFADLYATNSDIVGWLKIDGLGIDYPVVQTTDDAYYLKHDFMRNKSDYGTVFLSSGNNAKDLDLNNVIYGHTMRRDNQMFTPLKEYKTLEGFKKNPIIEYNTLYANYKFKVYAVFITNGDSTGDVNNYLFDYTFANLANTSAFAGFINQVNMRKLYTTGVSVMPDDKLLTLSTCTYEFDNARLVVIARLIREGESEEIDFSKAAENKNPRYPQAWYTANKKENPYKDEAQWRPTEAKTTE